MDLGVRRRRDITSGLMRLRDAAQAAIQGRDFVRPGQVGEIQRDRLWGGWQEFKAVQRTPLGEIGPVDAVRLQGVGRLGMPGVVACILGDLLEDAVVRYLSPVFCYGANMGPSQAARSLDGLDRRQIAGVNLHHVTEDGLDDATTLVVTGYNRFLMIRAWGSGKHVSADGTKWDLCERNLL